MFDAGDMATLNRRPWRRYLHLSLRSLLALVLVWGIWLGWIVHCAQVQREAVAAIERAGGEVRYDWQWKDNAPVHGKPWGPKWLVDRVGIDYFGHVTLVNLVHRGPERESVLSHVGRLGRLQELCVHSSSVTDAGLARIRELKNLRRLILYRTQVTDAGLVYLKGLTNLSELYLNQTRVTDVGVRTLQETLPKLRISR
jgi:hypothetical protein